MVEIPYWWDRAIDSPAAAIHRECPDLLSNPTGSSPIPLVPPRAMAYEYIDCLAHGQAWDGIQDITGWWMSEKMDGVRAYWDGNYSRSRQGNKINAANWFTQHLPSDITLDGEIWMGRSTSFEDINRLLKAKSANWDSVGYYIFDLPSSSGTYDQRIAEMERLGRTLPDHIHIVSNILCTGTHHLREHLAHIIKNRGEGIIIRQPDAPYKKGTTNAVLKVKVPLRPIFLSLSGL